MRIVKTALLLGFLFVACFAGASESFFPKPSSSALPMYPEGARKARVAGRVKVWFILNADGAVTQTGVISGNPLLREATVNIVKTWTFPSGALRSNIRNETEFEYVLSVQSKEGEPRLIVSMADYRRVKITSELYVEPIE